MNKTIVLIVLVIGFFGINKMEAQMAAAKKIMWDVKVVAKVNTYKGAAWRIITDDEKFPSVSNGTIKSVTTNEEGLDPIREVVFTNGNTRSETIIQTDYVYKFMVIKINKNSLPQGIKNAEIAVFTNEVDDDNSTITWTAKIEGKKSAKQKLKTQLKSEFESYAKGLSTINS